MNRIHELEKQRAIEHNLIFVGTIYDTFEALEETLEKLKLDEPRRMIRMAKNNFASEVFKYAKEPTMPVRRGKTYVTGASCPMVH